MNGLLGFGDKLYQAFLVEDRWRLYLDGLGVTLGITLGAICISTVLGMVLCLMKMSRHRILRWPAQAYIDIIRGIPVVVQLLIMYNVVLLNVTDNKMVVAVIAFGLNSSAYMAEIYRSGINAVDPGQMEAGRSLGLSKVQTMWSVIFPQALKNCLPTYTSEFIVLVKETSNGEYRLKDLDTKNPSIAKAEDSFELRNGVARINLTNKGVTNASDAKQGTDYIYADSKTVFVVGTYDSGARENWKNATYRAYTGINNAPTIVDDNDSSPATNAIGMSYYCRNNGVATIVYLSVDEADYKVTGGNNDVIFFAFESGSKKIEDSDNEYYTYNAVVDGKIVEGVKVDASVKINNRTSNGSFSSNVVFTGADYDDGVITGLDSLSNSGTVTGINKVNNENVVLGYGNGSESTYVVADDAKIFFIDDDGTITEGAVSNIRRSDEDVVTYVLEDGQISYLFVQQYFEDNDQSSSGGRQELTSITGVSYRAPDLTLTLNGTNAGQNYKVTLKMIVAGVTTELGTYTVTGATGATSTTAVLSVGTLASIAASGGIYMVSCGGQNATFTA